VSLFESVRTTLRDQRWYQNACPQGYAQRRRSLRRAADLSRGPTPPVPGAVCP